MTLLVAGLTALLAQPSALPPPVPVATESASARAERRAEADRRSGNAMLIGAGITFAFGTVFNGVRARVASGTCQKPGQPYCSAAWGAASAGAWIANVVAIGLVAGGGASRGSADASSPSDRLQRRRATARVVGPIVGVVGVLANLTLRALWLTDYSNPREHQAFDFARRSDALMYYGGLQLTAIAAGGGLAAGLWGHARAPRQLSLAPVIGRRLSGIAITGRF